jgi:ketosteroid isomerase-like protein
VAKGVAPARVSKAWDCATLLAALPRKRDSWLVVSVNVGLVQSVHESFARGDYSSVEWAHPEVEFVFADGPSPGSWMGLAGMAEAWRDFLKAWEDFRIETDEYRELDGERVLVLGDRTGRGKTSGLEVGQRRAEAVGLFHVRGGKVTRIVFYFDREHALTAVGLASEAGAPN